MTEKDYDLELDEIANAPEGSFKQVPYTTQEELDQLDPDHREGDEW